MWADAKSVRNAVKSTLKRAEEKQIKRLAFPALGTGAGALAVERCADILIEEVLKHCEADQTVLEEVMFVLYDEKPFAIFEEKFKVRVLGEAPTPEVADPRSLPELPAPAQAAPSPAGSAGPVQQLGGRRPGKRPEPTRRYGPTPPRREGPPPRPPAAPAANAPEAKPAPPPAAAAPPPPPPPAPTNGASAEPPSPSA
jgi:hypothetical protein